MEKGTINIFCADVNDNIFASFPAIISGCKKISKKS